MTTDDNDCPGLTGRQQLQLAMLCIHAGDAVDRDDYGALVAAHAAVARYTRAEGLTADHPTLADVRALAHAALVLGYAPGLDRP